MAKFDFSDSLLLASRFPVPELRNEIKLAERRATAAKCWRDTPYQDDSDLWPWDEYAEVCRDAIETIRASQPKPRPIAGHVDVEGIKARSDIVGVVGRYTILKKSGNRYQGLCPLHADKKSPSLVVYPDQQSWHCFGCNQGGDIFSFIQAVEHCDFKQAAGVLGGGL